MSKGNNNINLGQNNNIIYVQHKKYNNSNNIKNKNLEVLKNNINNNILKLSKLKEIEDDVDIINSLENKDNKKYKKADTNIFKSIIRNNYIEIFNTIINDNLSHIEILIVKRIKSQIINNKIDKIVFLEIIKNNNFDIINKNISVNDLNNLINDNKNKLLICLIINNKEQFKNNLISQLKNIIFKLIINLKKYGNNIIMIKNEYNINKNIDIIINFILSEINILNDINFSIYVCNYSHIKYNINSFKINRDNILKRKTTKLKTITNNNINFKLTENKINFLTNNNNYRSNLNIIKHNIKSFKNLNEVKKEITNYYFNLNINKNLKISYYFYNNNFKKITKIFKDDANFDVLICTNFNIESLIISNVINYGIHYDIISFNYID